MPNVACRRTTTILPDNKTVCLAPVPTKGCKERLEQGRSRESRKEFRVTFDRVLGEDADQFEVYDQVRACVRYAFLGNARLGVVVVPSVTRTTPT